MKLFSAEAFARLTADERAELMRMQMSKAYTRRGGCAVCSQPIHGSGWCRDCSQRFAELEEKAIG
jgi:hypothetical protein